MNIHKTPSFVPSDNDGTFRGLSQKTENSIIHDYLNNYLTPSAQNYLTLDEIRMEYYFGSFNGYVVVGFMGGTGTKDVVVAGREFWFPRLVQMLVWDSGSGNFCTIHEAYTNKLLSEGIIQSMYEQHYGGAFIGLDAEIAERMKPAYYKNLTSMEKILEHEKRIEENISNIPVVRNEKLIMYFGTYNGYIVHRFQYDQNAIFEPIKTIAAGIQFNWPFVPNSSIALVWNPNDEQEADRFYKLDEAYANGFLDEVDIRRIYELYLRDFYEDSNTGNDFNNRYSNEFFRGQFFPWYDYYLNSELDVLVPPSEWWFPYHFGVYNGCGVAAVHEKDTPETTISLAGMELTFPRTISVYAFKPINGDSFFDTLQEAYDAGILSVYDIYSIYKRYIAYNLVQ